MYSQYYSFKDRAIALRKKGKTYGEIRKVIGKPISKSTLSNWFRGIVLTSKQQNHISKKVLVHIRRAQAKAQVVNKANREAYILSIRNRVKHFPNELQRLETGKIALAMLYLGEGEKNTRGSLTFGNSNPAVIRLFLQLLRYCYDIEETKFRCTLQCRADQNIKKLEKFWASVTGIPPSQFYSAKIDPRTVGKPTKKIEYKGVCRIDYFSADIFLELREIVVVINEGP